ncbi:hypothetical protein AVEN_89509-1 [Araneus ventricosus]|uniref:Uncharacterized protein n=1 Tax=Araneus ventricosus TaxID=182803 RepID=A0A4Y2KJI1_ARAVE|nr:hypothetical protein AVEN_89509-1 [Araneus ventricosus]
MYHPSNGSPRTAITWGYIAVHEKREANRAATASHGELPRLPSREGMKRQKTQKEEKTERDQILGYLGVVIPVTSKEDVPLRGSHLWLNCAKRMVDKQDHGVKLYGAI